MEALLTPSSHDMPKVLSDSEFERVECPVCVQQDRHALLFRIAAQAEVLYSKPEIEIEQAAIEIEIKCQRCDRLIKLTLKLPVEFIDPGDVELG